MWPAGVGDLILTTVKYRGCVLILLLVFSPWIYKNSDSASDQKTANKHLCYLIFYSSIGGAPAVLHLL